MKRVSMKELAGQLGVDRATISRALSTDKAHLVAAETRERIRKEASRLSYRPDLMAATLRRGRSYTVGILVSDLMNEVIVRVVRRIVGYLDREDRRGAPITPLIAETAENTDTTRHLLRIFLSRRVDAILSLSATEDDAEALMAASAEVPVVLAVRSISCVSLPSATCNDDAAGALVAAHLKEQGHSVVCQLQGPQTAATFRSRSAGFSRSCAEKGLVEGPIGVIAPAALSRFGKARFETIRAAEPGPTAVFAHNDGMAIGLIEAMRQHGLHYPGDIGIVGFNNTELSRVLATPLTTVDYPVAQVGDHAGQLVEALIADRDAAWESVAFEPELIDRGSAWRHSARYTASEAERG